MRILAVRGANLTSLDGTFSIDFDREPLRRAGLFAITGPTGAGKSTILDALCLALFDRMPRLPEGRGEMLGLEGDPNSIALILTGHCYMRGGALSELSERKILGGNLHALPVDIFPEDAAYVALGHLHRAQAVGGRETVRYSGSPIPLALDEEPYPHQVMLAEFASGQLVGHEALRVPRHVPILRISEPSPDAALDRLKRLELDNALPRDAWPFLEVTVTLPEPRPALRDEVEAVLAGRPVRLLKLGVRLTGSGQTLADSAPPVDLASLEPEEVFRRLYRRSHEGDPEPDLMAAFHELLTGVQETM